MFQSQDAKKLTLLVALLIAAGITFQLTRPRGESAAQPTAARENSESTPLISKPSVAPSPSPSAAEALTQPPLTKLPAKELAVRELRKQARGAETGRPWEEIAGWSTLTERERVIEWISKPFVLNVGGASVLLELALNEVYLPHLPEGQRLQTLDAQPDAQALVATVEAMHQPGRLQPQLVFYIPGMERDARSRRVLTEQVMTESADVSASVAHARAVGYADTEEFAAVPGFVLTRADQLPGHALLATAAMAQHADSRSVETVMNREMAKRLVPNDPLFTRQWHLRNTGQSGGKAGSDAKVVDVWDTYRGQGITMAVIDDGVQHDHPDLSGNYVAASSIDYVDADSDPYPDLDFEFHGTAVAGVMSAEQGNSLGVSGAAPLSKIAGFRLLGSNKSPTTESQAFSKDNQLIQIKNNSWGPFDLPDELGTISAVAAAALQNGALAGRGGLGTISVFAAGNGRLAGDQGNKDAYANSIYTFAIGAVTNQGALSPYSETGAQLIAVAPSNGGTLGVTTTDLLGDDGYNRSNTPVPKDYTGSFGGTSSAAPLASGVIALMLEANPNLGWRDVKEILLRSGTQLSPTSTGWVSRYGGSSSLPPIRHHHSFGGGMVNASVAVPMAENWINLPAQTSTSLTNTTNRGIPDNNPTGVTILFDFSEMVPMRVEMVTVRVNINHTFKGDLAITLVSPTGVNSQLATSTDDDPGDSYVNWTFTSNRHWGDTGAGIWRLIIADNAQIDQGFFDEATVTLYGTPHTPVEISNDLVTQLLPTGGPGTFTISTTGSGDYQYAWFKNTTKKIAGATAATFTIPSLVLADAGRYSCLVNNVTGEAESSEVFLGVVDSTATTSVVAENAKIILQAKAQGAVGGPAFGYQWYRGMTPLADGPTGNGSTIIGAESSKLEITGAQLADSSTDYRCEVTMGALDEFTGDFTVHVVTTPVVQVPSVSLSTFSVSEAVNLPISSTGFPSTWVVKGLPSGMKFDSKTGIISGTPNVGGTFVISVSAKNPAGTGTMSFSITVQPLPDRVVGVYRGLLAREPMGNAELGGFLQITTTKTGTFSGTVTRGSRTHRVTGRLAATAAMDPMVPNDSNASVVIKQTGTLPQLQLSFAIDPDEGNLTGTLAEGANWSLAIEAWENPFSNSTPASEFEGIYNTALLPPAGVVEGEAPQGISYGRLTVTKAGTATWSGKLADGTAASFSTAVGKTGRIPCHRLLYANTGSYRGWLTVVPDVASSFANNNITAEMDWLKKAQPESARSYELGFLQTGITGKGAKWVKPLSPNIVLGLPGGAEYTFSQGGITTSQLVITPATALTYAFAISDKNIASRLLPNPANVTLTFSATTGVFSGTATLLDGTPAVRRTLSYAGIMISGTENLGFGYFTLPKLPVPPEKATATNILSGLLNLGAP
jgi:subtilisin family serine protease/subtilisin-like proprotein convertase family protein